jgi:hypothetical protein
MLAEAAAAHERSLGETARTGKLIHAGMAWSIDGTRDVRRLKSC